MGRDIAAAARSSARLPNSKQTRVLTDLGGFAFFSSCSLLARIQTVSTCSNPTHNSSCSLHPLLCPASSSTQKEDSQPARARSSVSWSFHPARKQNPSAWLYLYPPCSHITRPTWLHDSSLLVTGGLLPRDRLPSRHRADFRFFLFASLPLAASAIDLSNSFDFSTTRGCDIGGKGAHEMPHW